MAPHKKGRARDVVPHREHRTSKKATGKSNSPLIAPTRAALVVVSLDLDSLPLPADLWLRTMACLDVTEICRCENSSKALWETLNRENTLWQKLCTVHFPSMYSSVCLNPIGCPTLSSVSNIPMELPGKPIVENGFSEAPDADILDKLPPNAPEVSVIDWKMLFARRWQKQRKWERDRCKTQSSATGVSRRCTACGELCEDEKGADGDCAIHPGDFLPRHPADWSRVELQQLQGYAAQLGAALEEAPPSNAVPGSTAAVDTGPRALDSKAGAPKGTGQKVLVRARGPAICACVSLDMCPALGLVVEQKISLAKVASLEPIDLDEYSKR